MKKTVLTIILITVSFLSFSQTRIMRDTLIDSRDGKIYPTISFLNSRTNKIDTWMAQNLAYNAGNGCITYNKDENIVDSVGYLYDYFVALRVCPDGWFLPSNNQWNDLISEFGIDGFTYDYQVNNDAGYVLKSANIWTDYSGSDSIGFNVIPSGIFSYSDNAFYDIDKGAFFWSQTAAGNDYVYIYYMLNNSNAVNRTNQAYKKDGYSVRCKKR